MSPDIPLLPLLILPGIISGPVYFLRTWKRVPQITAFLSACIVAYLVHSTAVGVMDDFMGRSLVLDLPAKQTLLIALAGIALGNLTMAIHPVEGFFSSTSLILASLVGLAATIDNLTLASLFLLVAAVIIVLAWQVGPRARGQTQYFVAAIIGSLALAYAAGLMDEAPDLPSRVGLIGLELGAGLLLGLLPLGLWEVNLGRDSHPLPTTIINTSLKPASLLLLWRFTTKYVWLSSGTLLPGLLKAAAIITIVYCSLRASLSVSSRSYVSAALQAQFALIIFLVLPELGSSSLLPVTTLWLLARIIPALLLTVASIGLLQKANLLSKAIFVLAVMAVLGLPGTPLFPVQLSGLTTLPRDSGLLMGMLILSGGLAIGAAKLVTGTPDERATTIPTGGIQFEIFLASLVLAVIMVFLGLKPLTLVSYLFT